MDCIHLCELFSCFASRLRSRAAKHAECENLRFSSVLTYPPGGLLLPLRVNSPCRRQSRNQLKGLRPLNNPEVFGQSKSRHLTALRLSKKWQRPLFRGVHIALAPMARPALCAKKALRRKAFRARRACRRARLKSRAAALDNPGESFSMG